LIYVVYLLFVEHLETDYTTFIFNSSHLKEKHAHECKLKLVTSNIEIEMNKYIKYLLFALFCSCADDAEAPDVEEQMEDDITVYSNVT